MMPLTLILLSYVTYITMDYIELIEFALFLCLLKPSHRDEMMMMKACSGLVRKVQCKCRPAGQRGQSRVHPNRAIVPILIKSNMAYVNTP